MESEHKRALAKLLVRVRQAKQQHRLMSDAVRSSISAGAEPPHPSTLSLHQRLDVWRIEKALSLT